MSQPAGPVLIRVTVEGFGGVTYEVAEVDRAEWDALSPAGRSQLCQEIADDVAGNIVSWGWTIRDDDDMQSTVG